ncbi:hypothetical protein [Streptomyces odontomachi]|uniref:hypothetical protein n=1 Tax=Streptomyces odontomachi TaxID=2944940 RepID=UPI0021086253|nr:hypothetical protein [Streptomyces sp. ODS25]
MTECAGAGRNRGVVRLLPWTNADGNPCFMYGDAGDPGGYVSDVADELEEAQLELAEELLGEAARVLAGRTWTQGELHLLAVRLTESLGEVHRVAVSRGARLPGVGAAVEPRTEAAAESGKLVERGGTGDARETTGTVRRRP